MGPRELPTALLLFTCPSQVQAVTARKLILHFSAEKKHDTCPLHRCTLPTWPAPLNPMPWPGASGQRAVTPEAPGTKQVSSFLLLGS